MAYHDGLEALATVHFARWESEAKNSADRIPKLDFERGSDGAIIDICRRVGLTEMESILAGFAFIAGMHFGKELEIDPYDAYAKLREIIEDFKRTATQVHADRER